MEIKFLIFYQVILLIFLHSSLPIFSRLDPETLRSFDFLKNLYGFQKGARAEGLSALKTYLQRFGYLSYPNQANINSPIGNEFDEALETALKTYQQYFNLTPTGTLDSHTVQRMMMPRCGMPDIHQSATSSESTHDRVTNSVYDVSHYSFLGSRWPANKTHLTYAFLSHGNFLGPPCARAFAQWASVSRFRFLEVQNYNQADIKISFQVGPHGDRTPFDGPNGLLAHAFSAPDGRLHLDGTEKWSMSPIAGAFDIETVALHEIGHILGLNHSTLEAAIMYPVLPFGSSKGLNQDDVQGIRALYGS